MLPPLQGNHDNHEKHDVNDEGGAVLHDDDDDEIDASDSRLDATVSAALFATNASFTYLLSWVILHHKFMGVS